MEERFKAILIIELLLACCISVPSFLYSVYMLFLFFCIIKTCEASGEPVSHLFLAVTLLAMWKAKLHTSFKWCLHIQSVEITDQFSTTVMLTSIVKIHGSNHSRASVCSELGFRRFSSVPTVNARIIPTLESFTIHRSRTYFHFSWRYIISTVETTSLWTYKENSHCKIFAPLFDSSTCLHVLKVKFRLSTRASSGNICPYKYSPSGFC
jgi:hypothetical protein